MSSCNFVCSFPDYVLDRTIVIEDGHEHKISGFKLANASEYFKAKLKEMRTKEIDACKNQLTSDSHETSDKESRKESIGSRSDKRRRTKSLDEMDIEKLFVSYDDRIGLEYVISFIHCQGDLSFAELEVNKSNIVSIMKAGDFLKVPSVMEHCFVYVKSDLFCETCWDYLALSADISEYHQEMCQFINDFILENFLEASKEKEILQISYETLREFLQSDKLNCKNEMDLFDVIERWIEYDENVRASYCCKLIECLRLNKLTVKELDQVASNKFVKLAWNECSNIFASCHLNSEEFNKVDNGFSAEMIELLEYMRKSRFPREAIMVVGGWEGNQDDPNFGPSKAIQIYNNRTDTWRKLVTEEYALKEGHAYSACVLINFKLYVLGGYVSSGPTQMLKVFDLVTKCWKVMSPMHEKRNYISACTLDDFIYAIGGHNGRTRLNSVEKYDAIHNHWLLIAPMKQVRSDAGSDSLNGKVFVCGGFDGHHFYASVEIYDPVTNQWTNATPMSNIRSGVSMVALGIYLYAIGGNDGLQRLRSVERYDSERNRWQVMPSMIRQRSNFCVSVLENEVYVMGGWSDETNSTIALVEKWTPGINNEWETAEPLVMPASANCCCSVVGFDFIQHFLGH